MDGDSVRLKEKPRGAFPGGAVFSASLASTMVIGSGGKEWISLPPSKWHGD